MQCDKKTFPTLHVVGENIPQAYFRAIKVVWEHGLSIRTQYDRQDDAGNYIDPPSRDARVLIEVKNPFAQPRYPPISFCEIGTYIAEILGFKDHRVLPMEMLVGTDPVPEHMKTWWPYSYHQRLTAHPETNGNIIDQLAMAVELVAQTPHTRRAMTTTAVPNLDPFLKEDIPCLREIQLRCVEQTDGSLLLCPSATWRSRDLYKAWGDNMIALTFWMQTVAKQITKQNGRRTELGSWADYSASLHIYGQDFDKVAGNSEKGLQSFFDTFDEETFIARSLTSEMAAEMLVIPQLEALLTPASQANWQFPDETLTAIRQLINDIKNSTLIV